MSILSSLVDTDRVVSATSVMILSAAHEPLSRDIANACNP